MRYLPILLLLLSGCTVTATGPTFNPSMVAGDDSAKVVVYRDGGPLGISAGLYPVEINGEECMLNPKSFVVRNVSGDVHIESSMFGSPGTSRIDFKAEKKKTYYVRLEPNMERANTALALGFVGELIHESGSSNGPFIFNLMYKDSAESELAAFRQDCI